MVNTPPLIIGGVDTHADTHTVAALNSLGQLLGHATFAPTGPATVRCSRWLGEHGQLDQVGVEGTGSYGAGWPGTCPARASPSSRSTDPTGSSGDATASPTRPTRWPRPGGTGRDSDRDAEVPRWCGRGPAGAAVHPTQRRKGSNRSVELAASHGDCRTRGPTRTPRHTQGQGAGQRLRSAAPDPEQLHDPLQATKISLRRLARRASALSAELAEVKADIKTLSPRPHPTSCHASASDPTPPPSCWSPPATTPTGSTTTPPSPPCASQPGLGLLRTHRPHRPVPPARGPGNAETGRPWHQGRPVANRVPPDRADAAVG